MNLLITETLPRNQLIKKTLDLIRVLSDKGLDELEIEFGFNTNYKDQFKPFKINIKDLPGFFMQSIEAEWIIMGYSDLFIRSNNFEFQLCNDADLHFYSKDKELFELVKRDWNKDGIKVFTQNQLNEKPKEYT